MYYFVVNNLFLCFVIISTLHISGTICQDENIPDQPVEPQDELKNLREEYKALKTDNEFLKQESNDLMKRAQDLQQRLEALERLNEETARANRRNNVVIYGVPNNALAPGERAADLVKKIGDAINFPITDKDIIDCYRLQVNERASRHGDPMLIKFASPDIKDLFMKKLKMQDVTAAIFGGDRMVKIFVNEHLTKTASMIFREALGLKHYGYPFVWTKNGYVYVKKGGEDQPAVRVETLEQVSKLLDAAKKPESPAGVAAGSGTNDSTTSPATAESVTEPAAEFTTPPAVESAINPVANSTAQQDVESTAQEAAESTSEAVAEPETEATAAAA
ncbi:uncharacterized protein LOC135845659 isoform X1 [Planococcus citri]|uniref:uncharacterized protein LOC135845659 isoform X1 n=1 Tax=Planococcus citri TaxID=170843 RepID=UPI0031FA1490